jgi:hypothetical protein
MEGEGNRYELRLKVMTSSPEVFWANSTLIEGDKEAILIDALFTEAVELRRKTAEKERYDEERVLDHLIMMKEPLLEVSSTGLALFMSL